MPNPADLLSLQDDEDPDDQLRMMLDQNQGANLAGAPQPPGTPTGMPQGPSPNIPGPLAALAGPTAPGKPRIKLISKPAPKPKIKLKAKVKPRIKLKAPTSALQDFLSSIGRTP